MIVHSLISRYFTGLLDLSPAHAFIALSVRSIIWCSAVCCQRILLVSYYTPDRLNVGCFLSFPFVTTDLQWHIFNDNIEYAAACHYFYLFLFIRLWVFVHTSDHCISIIFLPPLHDTTCHGQPRFSWMWRNSYVRLPTAFHTIILVQLSWATSLQRSRSFCFSTKHRAHLFHSVRITSAVQHVFPHLQCTSESHKGNTLEKKNLQTEEQKMKKELLLF